MSKVKTIPEAMRDNYLILWQGYEESAGYR